MNRMRTTPAVIAMLLLMAAALPVLAQESVAPPHGPLPVVKVTLAHAHYITQVATTDDSRAYGLMNRTTLPADHAMLFVFRHAEPRWFWMKDTKIPLDILFFDAQRRLVSMQLDALPCKADPCKVYPSGKPAQFVLELAAGSAKRIGVGEGAQLHIHGDYGNVQ
jgi:uncharacterized membrane protein (UPF0127 family)